MIKSEQEIQKVIKAMGFIFLHNTYLGYSDDTPKEFMEGCTAKFSLKPGQSEDGSELMSTEFKSDGTKENYVPPQGLVTKTLEDFVLAVRKVFTSIHEYKKVLSIELTKVPSEEDLEWARAVMKSYDVTPTKQYVVCVEIPGSDFGVIIDISYGQQALDSLDLLIKSGWFIPSVEGMEQKASKPEDRDKLKTGLTFREL